MRYSLILLLATVFFIAKEISCEEPGLDVLFDKIIQKQQKAKHSRMVELISKGAPSGVEALIPAIAEYETFRSDKSVNFLQDGNGHVVFRQYRRIRISDLLSAIPRRKAGAIL